jgi:hypothetical protein
MYIPILHRSRHQKQHFYSRPQKRISRESLGHSKISLWSVTYEYNASSSYDLTKNNIKNNFNSQAKVTEKRSLLQCL